MKEETRRWATAMTDVYERLLAPVVFAPFAADLARRIAAQSPKRVLEVAAGTGIVTRALVDLPGVDEVVATDLNSSMVEAGRRSVPGAQWETADALDLPFAAGEFDAVVCQFGVMFFPDKVAGMAEARRVLAPDGIFYANTWGPLDTHHLEVAFTDAVRSVLPKDPPDFLATVPHGYADSDRLAHDATAAGFTDVAVDTITLRNPPISARDAAIGYCTGTPTRAALEARGDLDVLTEAVAGELERAFAGEPFSGEMTAHVLTARR